MVMILSVGNVWATSVTWPGTSALPSTATSIASDANVTIKTSSSNTYTNPIRIYANNTITIAVVSGYTIESVTYEASSTGNYVTYAQDATVSPSVTPTVSGKNVTWSFSSTTTTFTFTPSSQTRSNGITVVYSSTGGDEPGGGDDPEPGEETAGTGTIEFGTSKVKIDAASDSGDDNLGNTWTITTVGTTSFTQNAEYSQVGSSSKPATSITFTTTLSQEMKVSAFSAKFGGFNSTAGTVTLKVGNTTVGTGSLNGTNDVTVNATNTTTTGTVLTVTVTGISKGVKAYDISYTLEEPGAPAGLDAPVISATGDDYDKTVTISATAGATIRYTLDGNEPTSNSTEYTTPFAISSTTTVKAIAIKDEQTSSVASQEYTLAPAYTTIKELQENTPSSGSIPVRFTFNNVKVTFVSGKNAYINDGTNGMIIFSDGHALEVGNILNGEIKTTLTKFQGNSELTTFTKGSLVSGTEEVTPIEKAISAITFANVGMIVDLGQLTYSNSSFSDGNNTIAYYDKFSTGLALTNGTYNVKGIVIRYNNIIQIAPRTVDDIVAPTAKANANTQWVESSKVVRIGDATTNWWSTSSNGAKTFGSSKPSVATISNEGVITLVAPGQTNLTFSTAETDEYYAGTTVTLALTVKAALPAGGEEFTWVAKDQGYENAQNVTTASETPIAIAFAKGEGSNDPKFYGDGSASDAVRVYKNNTITIGTAANDKLMAEITFNFGPSDNSLSGNGLVVDETTATGTWSGLAKELTFINNTSGSDKAYIRSINVVYAPGTVTELVIDNVSMKISDVTHTIVPKTHNPNSAPIEYTIATADQEYATIEDGVITAHKLTTNPVIVTARIAQGANYTAAETTFMITITEKPVAVMSFPEESYDVNLGETFTAPELTKPDGVSVTYSSDNAAVSVNETTGAITINAEGTAIITATSQEHEDYAVGTASYTLNVTDPYKDVLTATGIGQASYANWSNKTFTSDVKYAGNSTTNSNRIQMRASDNSGIVTTTTIGYLKSISAAAEKGNTDGHKLQIYAKNTAYASAADLYDANKRGTLIGTIAEAGGNMIFEEGKGYADNYKYIGIKSASGAVYYDDITIAWTPVEFTTYSVKYQAGEGATGEEVVVDGIEGGATIQLAAKPEDFTYADHAFVGWKLNNAGETLSVGDDYDVTGNATFVAQWSEAYTITYKAGDGEGDDVEVSNLPSGLYHLAANTFTAPQGKVFIGWKLEDVEEDVRAAGSEYTITGSVAFVAQWMTANVVTFVAGTDKSESSPLIKSGITIAATTFNNNDYYQCYSGSSMTISSEVGEIISIELTCTAEGSEKYGPGNFTLEGYSASSYTGIWSGLAEEVAFGAASQQVRMTQIVVTYIPNGNVPKQPAGLSYTTASYEIYKGESFDAPTLNNPNELVVTYSGNNDEVATVNAETGAITLGEATGSVTITASADAQGDYLAGTATYTLTVKAPVVIDDLTGTWQLVTDASQLVAGKKVIIASIPEENAAVTMSTTQAANNRIGQTGAAISEGLITAQNGTAVFTLETGTVENTLAFKSSSDEYLYAASSDKNYIRSQATNDANGSWTISIEEGVATIVAQGEYTRNVMRYNPNNGSPIFACYASNSTTGTLVTLYMLEEDTPTPEWENIRTEEVAPNAYYTMCLDKAVAAVQGASIWKVISKAQNDKDIILEEVTTTEAGRPYIFFATVANPQVQFTGDPVNGPVNDDENNGLIGSFQKASITPDESNYIIYNNELYYVNSDNVYVGAHRAYLNMEAVPAYSNAPQQGAPRRRVTMAVHSEQVATGIDALNASDAPVKVLINGQLFIIRGEKMYDAKGQLVK